MSNLFGYQAGMTFIGNNIGANNIIIGTNISLPNAAANSMNIGGVLFGIGFQSNTSGNPVATPVAGGRIGIGIVAPAYTLDVGNGGVSGIVACFTNSTGNCTINPVTTSLSCSSDINLKKNITNMDTGETFTLDTISLDPNTTSTLDKLSKLEVVKYNWNSEADSTLKHTGFIAQNLEQIFSDLVATDEDGMKGVNYAGMTPYLVSAIKELNQKVDNGGIFAHLVASEDFSTEEAGLNFIELVKRALEKLSGIFINTRLWVESLRAEKVETKELCIDGICVTKEQLQGMLDSSGIVPKPAIVPISDPISEPLSEPEQTSDSAPDPIPESISDPAPETTPDPAPESAPEPTFDPAPGSEPTPPDTEEAPTSS